MRASTNSNEHGSAQHVAIVVPVSNRTDLTPDEQISLRHLTHYLGRYDRFLVAPEGLALSIPGFGVEYFDPKYFGSGRAHARMMLSRNFYRRFRKYTYILIYHLDALVFSDELLAWCDKGYDYIGAPWLRSPDTPQAGFARVGNGGLSLRRVESFLRVFDSRTYAIEPQRYDAQWRERFGQSSAIVRVLNSPRKMLKRIRRLNNVNHQLDRYSFNEDHFWSDEAARYYPNLKIAPVEEGLRFAFECAPRYCYEQNGNQLPFGCHAWNKHDPAFWAPFLLEQAPNTHS
jgi:Protein of unknown function (DUF5672)